MAGRSMQGANLRAAHVHLKYRGRHLTRPTMSQAMQHTHQLINQLKPAPDSSHCIWYTYRCISCPPVPCLLQDISSRLWAFAVIDVLHLELAQALARLCEALPPSDFSPEALLLLFKAHLALNPLGRPVAQCSLPPWCRGARWPGGKLQIWWMRSRHR